MNPLRGFTLICGIDIYNNTTSTRLLIVKLTGFELSNECIIGFHIINGKKSQIYFLTL